MTIMMRMDKRSDVTIREVESDLEVFLQGDSALALESWLSKDEQESLNEGWEVPIRDDDRRYLDFLDMLKSLKRPKDE